MIRLFCLFTSIYAFNLGCLQNDYLSDSNKDWNEYYEREIFSNHSKCFNVFDQLYQMTIHFLKLLRWCQIPEFSQVHINKYLPCGSALITTIPDLKWKVWHIVVQLPYAINLTFVNFEMDYSTDNCLYTSLTIYQHIGEKWCEEVKYCGHKYVKPHLFISNSIKLYFKHTNVIKHYNVSFNYMLYRKARFRSLSTFSKNKYIDNSYPHSVVYLDSNVFTSNFYFTLELHLVKILVLTSLECSESNVFIYDGPEDLYLVREIIDCSTIVDDILVFKYHIASIKWNNPNLTTNYISIGFHQKYMEMQLLHPDINMTIKHIDGITRMGLMMSNLNKEFYRIELETYSFSGFNSNNCTYGGLFIIVEDVPFYKYEGSNVQQSQLGPYCTRSPSIPFVGRSKHLSLPYGTHFIIFYGYGKFFNMHVKLVSLKQKKEGIINPCEACFKMYYLSPKYPYRVYDGVTYTMQCLWQKTQTYFIMFIEIIVDPLSEKELDVCIQAVGHSSQNKNIDACNIHIDGLKIRNHLMQLDIHYYGMITFSSNWPIIYDTSNIVYVHIKHDHNASTKLLEINTKVNYVLHLKEYTVVISNNNTDPFNTLVMFADIQQAGVETMCLTFTPLKKQRYITVSECFFLRLTRFGYYAYLFTLNPTIYSRNVISMNSQNCSDTSILLASHYSNPYLNHLNIYRYNYINLFLENDVFFFTPRQIEFIVAVDIGFTSNCLLHMNRYVAFELYFQEPRNNWISSMYLQFQVSLPYTIGNTNIHCNN